MWYTIGIMSFAAFFLREAWRSRKQKARAFFGVSFGLLLLCAGGYRFAYTNHKVSYPNIAFSESALEFIAFSDWGMVQYLSVIIAALGFVGIVLAYIDIANGR